MLNKLILQGRLVRDPILRKTRNGISCCNFTLAQNNSFKDKPWSLFQDCTAWGKMAENICSSFHQGDSFIAEGHLKTEIWTDKNGVQKKSNKLTIDVLHYNNIVIDNEIENILDNGQELVPANNIDKEIEDLGW